MTVVEDLLVKVRNNGNWDLWLRQTLAIASLELRRGLFAGRSLFILLLAGAPVLLFGLYALFPDDKALLEDLGGTSVLFAIIFRTFFLRLTLFFACVGVFTRLFRGDTLEGTLHYYFLAPVRREILVLGKYFSGITLTFLFFGVSNLFCFILIYLPGGWSNFQEFMTSGTGLGHLLAYEGVTLMACIGYGSVFLLTGLFFKNPIIPAGVILGWEYINFLLPPLLKKISVIYYLESLCPVPIPTGPVTILAEPAPFWMAVPGLVGVTVLVLIIAGLKIKRMEVRYGDD
jgi:hypothetical protein